MATSTYGFARVNGADLLNVITAGEQTESSVVATSDGRALVFFDAGNEIHARRLSATGEPAGNEVTVSAGIGALEPETTRLANGNVVVAWQDGSGLTKILGRIYTPDLTPVSDILVFEADAFFAHQRPDIAATADGGFIVVSNNFISATDTDIYVRKFDAAGASVTTTGFYPGSTLDRNPSVAVLANGNVAVAWERTVGAETEIWYAVYSPDLDEVKAPVLLDTSGTINRNVDVVARPDGSFTISYEDNFASGNGPTNITTYQLTAAGIPIDFDVTATTSGDNVAPQGATSIDGYQVVVNEDQTNVTDWDVRAAILTPNGNVVAVDDFFEGALGFQYQPSVTWLDGTTVQISFTTFNSASGGEGIVNSNGIAVSRFQVFHQQVGDATSETITGDNLTDIIFGLGGDDSLDGGGGADAMYGGAGDDTYYVENPEDLVDEGSNSDANDTVVSSISYTLGTAIENLVLVGTGWVDATGNGNANTLSGNVGNNVLDGLEGADTMLGNAGDDTYIVDNAGDVVNESEPGSSGFDSVYSSISFKLPGNVEALILTGLLEIDGKGNSLGNYIQGNAAENLLKGGGGNDTIMGLGGTDTINGGGGNADIADFSDRGKGISVTLNGSNTVTVREGNSNRDELKNIEGVFGTVFNDNLTGDGKANIFDGWSGKDTLKGGGGDDWLDGGFGKDSLTGGDGSDRFVFSVALHPSNADRITDFRHDQDKIALEDYLVSLFVGSKLNKGEFYASAGANSAHDASDRVIYNTSNGNLYFDLDGQGGAAAVKFATLTNRPGNLDHGDFMIV